MKLLVLFALVCTTSFAVAAEDNEEKVQKKRSLYDGYSGLSGSSSLGLPSITSHTHTHSSAIIDRPVPVPVPVSSYPLKSSSYIPSSLGYESYGLGNPLYSSSINKFSLSSYPSTFSSYPYSSYGLSSSSYPYNKFSSSILPSSYDYGYNYPLTAAKAVPTYTRTSYYPKISTYPTIYKKTYPTIYKKSYYSSPIISKW